MTSSLLPSTPSGYTLSNQTVAYGQGWYYEYDDDFVYGGMSGIAHDSITLFGETAFYELLAFNGGATPVAQPFAPIWVGAASVTFEAIPEPGTVGLLIASGGLLALYRRRKPNPSA